MRRGVDWHLSQPTALQLLPLQAVERLFEMGHEPASERDVILMVIPSDRCHAMWVAAFPFDPLLPVLSSQVRCQHPTNTVTNR